MVPRKLFGTLSPLVCFAMLLLFLAGCGSDIELGKVSGTVTKGGKPQPNLFVNFSPGEGRRGSQGYTDDNGQYSLRYTADKVGAVLGSQHVTITSESNQNKNLLSKDVDVASGSNVLNFDLDEGGGSKAAK
jgi:hypothetical protein